MTNQIVEDKKTMSRSSALPKQVLNDWGLKCVQNWDEQMLKIEERVKVSQAKLLSERQRNYTFQKSKLPTNKPKQSWPQFINSLQQPIKDAGEDGFGNNHDPEQTSVIGLAKALSDHEEETHSPTPKEHHHDGMRDYKLNNIHKIINVMYQDKGLNKGKEGYRVNAVSSEPTERAQEDQRLRGSRENRLQESIQNERNRRVRAG